MGQESIIKRVEALTNSLNIPHLLFAGPAGTGKSTIALIVVKELFGETWKENYLELNASDERGINVVREKVKNFARTKSLGDVPFKVIFLDEADALTPEAQQALRRTMENYTKTCRFILSCNYSSKILDPIQSRCVVFKFKPLPKDEIYLIIDKIAKIEGFTISEDGKLALFEVSQGDCRKVENILQSCAAISKEITEKTVYSIASQALPKEITQILTLSIDGKILESRKEMLNIMYENGLSGLDIIKQISSSIWKLDIENLKKLAMIKLCGEIEFRLVEGSDEFIQLQALLAGISLISNP